MDIQEQSFQPMLENDMPVSWTEAKRSTMYKAELLEEMKNDIRFTELRMTLGDRLKECSNYVSIKTSSGGKRRASARGCHANICDVCAMRKSQRKFYEAVDAFTSFALDHPEGFDAYLYTITLKNIPLDHHKKNVLRKSAETFMKNISGLFSWNVRKNKNTSNIDVQMFENMYGSYTTIEYPYNPRTHDFNIHIHVLALYKKGMEHFTPERISRYLKRVMRINYLPEVYKTDILINSKGSYIDSLAYVMRYLNKPMNHHLQDMPRDEAKRVLYVVTSIMKGFLHHRVSGLMKDYLSEGHKNSNKEMETHAWFGKTNAKNHAELSRNLHILDAFMYKLLEHNAENIDCDMLAEKVVEQINKSNEALAITANNAYPHKLKDAEPEIEQDIETKETTEEIVEEPIEETETVDAEPEKETTKKIDLFDFVRSRKDGETAKTLSRALNSEAMALMTMDDLPTSLQCVGAAMKSFASNNNTGIFLDVVAHLADKYIGKRDDLLDETVSIGYYHYMHKYRHYYLRDIN